MNRPLKTGKMVLDFTMLKHPYPNFGIGKSVYRLSSVNENQHIFSHLIGCSGVVTKSMSVYSKDP